MKNILFLSGDSAIGSKLNNLNLNTLSIQGYKFIHNEDSPISPSNITSTFLNRKICEDKQLKILSKLVFVYNAAKSKPKSESLAIVLRTSILGPYKLRDLKSIKSIFQHLIKPINMASIIIAICGLLKITINPLIFIQKKILGKFNFFFDYLNLLNINTVVLFSSGYDNLVHLINYHSKINNHKFILVINNWDNPSSKCFMTENFDLILLWNPQQIQHVCKLNYISKEKLIVIGSQTADLAYSKYKLTTARTTDNTKVTQKKLLYIGQQNHYDEIHDIINIQNYISTNESKYEKLFYKPHPLSKMKIKRIESNFEELKFVSIIQSTEIDLRDFDGIIALPTTLILEVILSRVPSVIYTPTNKQFRRDPRTMWKYEHFKDLKAVQAIEVVKDFDELSRFLKFGLPEQIPFNKNSLNYIFPEYSNNYLDRLKEVFEKNI